MSLDVYLEIPGVQVVPDQDRVFIREEGAVKQITRAEWDARFPDHKPYTFEGADTTETVYEANITHNLGEMAQEAGLYEGLWRPEEIGITKAADLIPLLRDGLDTLRTRSEHFKQFNPSNGWGNHDGLIRFVQKYLAACERYPEAQVRVSR